MRNSISFVLLLVFAASTFDVQAQAPARPPRQNTPTSPNSPPSRPQVPPNRQQQQPGVPPNPRQPAAPPAGRPNAPAPPAGRPNAPAPPAVRPNAPTPIAPPANPPASRPVGRPNQQQGPGTQTTTQRPNNGPPGAQPTTTRPNNSPTNSPTTTTRAPEDVPVTRSIPDVDSYPTAPTIAPPPPVHFPPNDMPSLPPSGNQNGPVSPWNPIPPATGRQDPRCPQFSDSRNPVHLPHENNCAKFYKCDHGMAFEYSCPQGQHWNAFRNYCDFPSSAGCQSSGIAPRPQPLPQPLPPQNNWNNAPRVNPNPGYEHPIVIPMAPRT